MPWSVGGPQGPQVRESFGDVWIRLVLCWSRCHDFVGADVKTSIHWVFSRCHDFEESFGGPPTTANLELYCKPFRDPPTLVLPVSRIANLSGTHQPLCSRCLLAMFEAPGVTNCKSFGDPPTTVNLVLYCKPLGDPSTLV